MVHVCDTAHGDKRCVVKSPADDGVDTGVVELVDLRLREIVVTALPADQIEDDKETKDA